MKKLLLLLVISLSTASYSQTPITDANFQQAINTCLSTNPEDGLCSDSEYGGMPDWDVSNVTDMDSAFKEKTTFNGDISNWDVSSVTNMHRMFSLAINFNQSIGNWDVSSVTNIRYMFWYATSFNQPIGDWDVSSITPYGATTGAFENADSFNQDLSGWDVSNMTSIASMFYSADSFNQDLSSWDISNITNMNWTFNSASSFNQNLSEWNIGNVNTMGGCFGGSGLSTVNYDNILIGWSGQELQQNVTLSAQGINYCDGASGRQKLIDDFGWTITDGGIDCSTASIEDQTQLDISIYPNPTSDIVYIDGNYTQLKVVIYNILGKEVINKSITNSIDISHLEKGVYILQLSDGAKLTTRKIIKN